MTDREMFTLALAVWLPACLLLATVIGALAGWTWWLFPMWTMLAPVYAGTHTLLDRHLR